MELIFEAGLKAVNKKAVQDEVSEYGDIADFRLAYLLLNRVRW